MSKYNSKLERAADKYTDELVHSQSREHNGRHYDYLLAKFDGYAVHEAFIEGAKWQKENHIVKRLIYVKNIKEEDLNVDAMVEEYIGHTICIDSLQDDDVVDAMLGIQKLIENAYRTGVSETIEKLKKEWV